MAEQNWVEVYHSMFHPYWSRSLAAVTRGWTDMTKVMGAFKKFVKTYQQDAEKSWKEDILTCIFIDRIWCGDLLKETAHLEDQEGYRKLRSR